MLTPWLYFESLFLCFIIYSLAWSDRAVWGRFDSYNGVDTTGSYSTSSYAFSVAQIMTVLASGYSILTVAVFASALRNSDKPVVAGIIQTRRLLNI